jgi:hypothetical protein
MWPFKKKIRNREQSKSDMIPIGPVVLTEEEQDECQNFIESMTQGEDGKVLCAPKEYSEAIRRCLMAIALIGRAERLLIFAGMEGENLKEMACSAAAKAWAIYPLPILLYDFACILDRAGKNADAKAIFKEFLRRQETFSPSPIDIGFLNQRDIPSAILHAKEMLSML